MDFFFFTGYFAPATQMPVVFRSLILKTERLLEYFRQIGDLSSAEKELSRLKELRSKKENISHIDAFNNAYDAAKLAMAGKDGPRSQLQLNIALSIINEKGEWQTISVSGIPYFYFWFNVAQIYLLNHQHEKTSNIIPTP